MAEVKDSDLEWERLLQLRRWTALDALGTPASHISDVLFRIGPCGYLICVPHGRDLRRVEGKRFITTLMWAESDGAARRAQLLDIEADEPKIVRPPDALLSLGGAASYGAIVDYLRKSAVRFQESASYRVGSDGAFVHRNILAPPYSFHFRGRDDIDKEDCYAIKYMLPDRMAPPDRSA